MSDMKIGIVPQENGEYFGVHQDYMALVERFGTPVIISPVYKEDFWVTYQIDALLLPGGSDVNPHRYGHIPHPYAYRPNIFLEHFDEEILPLIIAEKLPIFGVCRGLQTLNVHFGGTLWQHMWRHPYSTSKTDLVHEVFYGKGEKDKFRVNSFHHQCIWKLGSGLKELLLSKDNVIEAICHETLPIGAVQYHPERSMDDWTLKFMTEIFS